MASYKTQFNSDGSVTYWSVYERNWVRNVVSIPDEELAAMSAAEYHLVLSHLERHKWSEKLSDISQALIDYQVLPENKEHRIHLADRLIKMSSYGENLTDLRSYHEDEFVDELVLFWQKHEITLKAAAVDAQESLKWIQEIKEGQEAH